MMASVSRRTLIYAAAMVVAIGGIAAFMTFWPTGDSVSTAVSDIGGILVIGTAAIAALSTALSFDRGEPLRTQWMLIAGGVGLFALGDIAFAYYELATKSGEVPFPGLPDVFYLSQYALFGVGLILAAMAYRGLVSLRNPVIVAGVVSVALGIGLFGVFIQPVLADAEVSLAERVLTIAYPAADLVLLLGPALAIVLTIRHLQGGRLGWPWWAVAAGVTLVAVSDAAFNWLVFKETYQSGMLVDYGWMAGYALVGLGAMLALDVRRVFDIT